MTQEGFQLNPVEIANQIREDIARPGWQLSSYYDLYAHPDFETGMMMVCDEVDRAVVVFVGPRREAHAVELAAHTALEPFRQEAK